MPNRLLNTYLGSKELKKLLVSRSEELQIPFRYICHEIGIVYKDFMKQYINSNGINMEITEGEFERILAILGVSVRFQFVVDKHYRALEVQQKLKNNYEQQNNKVNGLRGQQADEEAGDHPVFDGDY
jgi:hypothetical protein